jgi:cell shape-determining protein MreC
MLLRISLIVAILTGVGALYLSQFKVAPKIETLTSDLKTATDARAAAEQSARSARSAERKANTELANTKKELDQTKGALTAMTFRANQQEARAAKAEKADAEHSAALTTADQELAAWQALGIKVEQVKQLQTDLAKTTKERDAYNDEGKVLLRDNNQLRVELAKWTGEGPVEVKLPAGLKGRIIAVDPKWRFVVLNIGAKDGVLKDGKMMIDRDGKLVGKVQITAVEPKRSIANILPAWQQTEAQEGDEVLY